MASERPLCQGIITRVQHSGRPFRRCDQAATDGEYCTKHAAQEARQTVMRTLLRPDWHEVQEILTAKLDGIPAYAHETGQTKKRKKTRKTRAPKARKAQPTPPVPVAPPAVPVIVAEAEPDPGPHISDLLPSREDAADAMAAFRRRYGG